MYQQQGTTEAQTQEQTFVSNPFGTVTNKRVVYRRAKGWFSGGSREDIPLRHVTSVRLDISRNIFGGIVCLVVGLIALSADSAGVKIIGLMFLVLSVLNFWGSPAVVVNTAGRDLQAAKGFPWHRGEANKFVSALHTQLFRD